MNSIHVHRNTKSTVTKSTSHLKEIVCTKNKTCGRRRQQHYQRSRSLSTCTRSLTMNGDGYWCWQVSLAVGLWRHDVSTTPSVSDVTQKWMVRRQHPY